MTKPISIDDLFVFMLAESFATVLKEWATPAQWQKMRRDNIANVTDACCASHDFCDANMAMWEAFTPIFGREMAMSDDDRQEFDLTLVNAAWSYAKKTYLTGSSV